MDGYSAESRAGELLEGIGIPVEQHQGPMSAVAPGWKLRVLLAQALFSDPDVLLLDEPTNNLDINTIRWLEEFLDTSKSTMVIISHDRHFLNSVCTHMADLDYGKLQVFPGNYDEYMTAATQARERMHADNAKKKVKMAELQAFVSRFSANASKARQATSRARQLEKIELEDIKPSSRVSPFIRFEQDKPLRRIAVEATGISKGFDEGPLFENLDLTIEAGTRLAISAKRHWQDHAGAHLAAGTRRRTAVKSSGRRMPSRVFRTGQCAGVRDRHDSVRLDDASGNHQAPMSNCCAARSDACCSPATTARSR